MTVIYKLEINPLTTKPNGVFRTFEMQDGVLFIPINKDNTDYQTFKQDLANGVALSDAEGTAMTADQIKTFLETLP